MTWTNQATRNHCSCFFWAPSPKLPILKESKVSLFLSSISYCTWKSWDCPDTLQPRMGSLVGICDVRVHSVDCDRR